MQDKVDRLHFMDSMRATLMVLGVVLHSAEVFNPKQGWIVHSSQPDALMGYLVNAISTFRMPAFFVVSGYFCFLTMRKYKVKKFLSVRMTRIVIPLVVTALTLNVLQAIFLKQVGWLPPLAEYFKSGSALGHLWFLSNLVVYFAIASLLALILPRSILHFIMRQVEGIFNKIPMILIVILLPLISVVMTAVLASMNMLYINIHGLYANYVVMYYLPFFFFGLLLGVSKDSLRQFSTVNPLLSITLVVISAVLLSMIDTSTNSDIAEIGVIYFTKLTGWASALVCFYVFYRLFDKQSSLMRTVSDASYTIYLFHHLFVIVLAVLLIKLEVPAIPAVLTMIVVVTGATFAIHRMVVSKNKILSFLYNGK